MKILSGKEIAGFVKERQARQVAKLRNSKNIVPKLAIIQVKDDPVIDTYVGLKKKYAADILVEVEHFKIPQTSIEKNLFELNSRDDVHGIIVQLPLEDDSVQSAILNLVSPYKDVDGLNEMSKFEPATPMAIMWLLSGYNISLRGKKIAIVGRGALVGDPLLKMLSAAGHDVSSFDRQRGNLSTELPDYDVVITATGSASLIRSDMLGHGVVVIDAGVAIEKGVTKGDLADDVYARNDISLTPKKGGVGPLTVCALFENVITSASRSTV